MKITIKEKTKVEPTIIAENVKPGYVFQYIGEKELTALKLRDNKIVMLKFSDGDDWFMLKDNTSWNNTPVKILGKLTEIVVESLEN